MAGCLRWLLLYLPFPCLVMGVRVDVGVYPTKVFEGDSRARAEV
jgi:hypothetical protein